MQRLTMYISRRLYVCVQCYINQEVISYFLQLSKVLVVHHCILTNNAKHRDLYPLNRGGTNSREIDGGSNLMLHEVID